jgi:hypothetical protein
MTALARLIWSHAALNCADQAAVWLLDPDGVIVEVSQGYRDQT